MLSPMLTTHYTQLTIRTHTVQTDSHTDATYTVQHVRTRGAARGHEARLALRIRMRCSAAVAAVLLPSLPFVCERHKPAEHGTNLVERVRRRSASSTRVGTRRSWQCAERHACDEREPAHTKHARKKVVGWAAGSPPGASCRGSGLRDQHVNLAARRSVSERNRGTCHLCGGRERSGVWQSRHGGNAA